MNPPLPDRPQAWSLAKLIGFRFGLIYLVLYGVPGVIVEIPLLGPLAEAYEAVWLRVVTLVGSVLGADVPVPQASGSGDQLASYLEIVALVLVAGLGTIVWSLADRKRAAYPRLAELLHIYLRYLLAFTMFMYGSVKVLKSQFPAPTPTRLLTPIGQTSPMGLMWTFMGYSTTYTFFAGLAEIAGGALLLFRRTTALGALVLVGVLGNVVVLNYSYDVPVKLYSTHLLLIAGILLAPHARRMVDFLILNRATHPAELGAPPFASRWRRPLLIGKALVVAAMVLLVGKISIDSYRNHGDGAARIAHHGAYQVLALERNGAPVAPGDPTAWRQVAIGNIAFSILSADDTMRRFNVTYLADRQSFHLQDRLDPTAGGELAVSPGPQGIVLTGELLGERISVRLRRMAESEFVLLDRGFNWVSEAPYNR